MKDKIIKLKLVKILLLVLPFLLFILQLVISENHAISEIIWNNNLKWLSILILFCTIFFTVRKQYKHLWYFSWVSFSLFYSIPFLIFKYIYKENFFDRLMWYVFGFMNERDLNETILPQTSFPLIVIFVLILTFFLLAFYKFSTNKDNLFVFLYSYYFIYCLVSIPIFLSLPQIRFFLYSTKSGIISLYGIIQITLIVNSLIFFIFMTLYGSLDKYKVKARVGYIIIFLFLNFFSINIHVFLSLTKMNNILFFEEFIYLLKFYIRYFLLNSNFLYLIIILLLLRFSKKSVLFAGEQS
jgi:hypothetical protein